MMEIGKHIDKVVWNYLGPALLLTSNITQNHPSHFSDGEVKEIDPIRDVSCQSQVTNAILICQRCSITLVYVIMVRLHEREHSHKSCWLL